ncbi:MAG: phosphatase PAP2 family protein [Candidatus Dormibacteria bacterium]
MVANEADVQKTAPASARRVRGISRHPVVYGVLLVYAVVSTILMLVHAVGVTSDHALLIALVVAAIVAPARAFVWDFLPFLSVGVMFSDVGTMVERNTEAAHTMAPILIERALFGGNVASVWLQQHLSGIASWIDIPLALVYLTFFAAPILFGVWLWIRHREHFGLFVTAYVAMMAIGFLVHVVYPETPPWLASRAGFLAPVDRITVSLLERLGGVGRLYAGADPAPYGAMPALHVAVPSLIAATIIGVRGRHPGRRWLWLAYPITMAFATVYLGEHYVLDAAAGMMLGFLSYAVVARCTRRGRQSQPLQTTGKSELGQAA